MHQQELDYTKIKSEKVETKLEQFVMEFLEDRKDELEVVKMHLHNLKLDEIRQIGHKWKGYSAAYGFDLLGEFGRNLEELTQKNDISCIKSVLEKVDKYLMIKERILKEG